MSPPPILEVKALRKIFTASRGFPNTKTVSVQAIDCVSFSVRDGESFGLVGESGCGKSTLGRCILQLIPPTSGEVSYKGQSVTRASRRDLSRLRQQMQIIFQDPYSSLNPRLSVAHMLSEPLRVHGVCGRREAMERVRDLLRDVGLPADAQGKYPHQFSGGQRQRLAIARALILEPELIVADEPVSALDVSIQAQIIEKLNELKAKRHLSFVFISHDLGIVRYFCDRIAVMYLGRLVELGPVPEIFDRPLHPYTRALGRASPIPDPEQKITFEKLDGEVPSPIDPPSGCHFHPRCPKATPLCRNEAPEWRELDAGRFVACHHPA
jgi:oligopeptide/dipeptide ABC transporter ATP-binding protein